MDSIETVEVNQATEWDCMEDQFSMTQEELSKYIAETQRNLALVAREQKLADAMLKEMDRDAKILAKGFAAAEEKFLSLMQSVEEGSELQEEGPAELLRALEKYELHAQELREGYEMCIAKVTEETVRVEEDGDFLLSRDMIQQIVDLIKVAMALERHISTVECLLLE